MLHLNRHGLVHVVVLSDLRQRGYNKGVKFAIVLLCGMGLLFAQQVGQQGPEKQGDFDIRVEPTAKLQTGVQVPFQVTVKDALQKPLIQAAVTLQIETPDHMHTKVFKAPAISPGVYIAKPVFPSAGDWNIYVEARRGSEMSARNFQFTVTQ